MMRLRWVLLLIVCMLALIWLSCKEPLPVYQDPRDVFDGIVEGGYNVSRTENAMKAYLTVVNKYDETLDARAILTGRIILTWQNDPTFRRTFELTDAQILSVRFYNSSTRELRLDPGDSIRLGISWNFLSDDGRDLKRHVIFKQDPTCRARFISEDPVHILITATMKIYDRTETVEPPQLLYRFVLVREYVDPRDC